MHTEASLDKRAYYTTVYRISLNKTYLFISNAYFRYKSHVSFLLRRQIDSSLHGEDSIELVLAFCRISDSNDVYFLHFGIAIQSNPFKKKILMIKRAANYIVFEEDNRFRSIMKASVIYIPNSLTCNHQEFA